MALATLCLVLFLTFLDNTVVSVGLANVQSSLHAGVTSLQWVVNGYALTFAAFMLAGGTLGDLLGRKKVMLAGVAVFCAGSVVAALATNVDWLIAGRVVMGLGAAASEPGTLSIIRHVYPDERTRADALGVWAAVSGLALALGPVIGGVLVGLWSWRAIFWFNLVFGAVAFAMALLFVPETSDRGGGGSTGPASCWAPLALATVSFAIIQGEQSGYRTWWIDRACSPGRRCRGAAFVVRRTAGARPDPRHLAVPPAAVRRLDLRRLRRLLRDLLHLLLHRPLPPGGGRTPRPTRPRVDFIPMAAGLIVASVLTGPWVARYGPRIPMTVGCVLAAVGHPAHQHLLGPHVGLPTLGWALPIAGVGLRHHAGSGDLHPPHGGAARALGHGRVGHQHQPGDGCGLRRGRAGRHRQRQTDRSAGGPAEGHRHTAELPEPRAPRGDGRRASAAEARPTRPSTPRTPPSPKSPPRWSTRPTRRSAPACTWPSKSPGSCSCSAPWSR